nr:basic 7S globulin-like [Tanacetum cinerariifolium]
MKLLQVLGFGSGAVTWSSKKQETLALSSFEAEYAAVTSAARQALWLRKLLVDFDCEQKGATDIFYDNRGVMALSSSSYALPAFLFGAFPRSFALCLPSIVSATGVLFLGSSTYYIHPHPDVDIRTLLCYTPFVKHENSFGHFIGVNSIVSKKRSIDVLANSTTKISTLEPYTILRTDLYNQVVRRFSVVTKRIPQAKPVAPFGLCFSTFTNSTQVSIKVPDIDFSLQDGNNWTISTANSIKKVTKDVACLAFVDGGVTSEHAIIIGTFQTDSGHIRVYKTKPFNLVTLTEEPIEFADRVLGIG